MLFLSLIGILSILMTACGAPGDPVTDDIYSQDLFPGTAHKYNVGSAKYPYKNGYFDNLFIDGDEVLGGAGSTYSVFTVSDDGLVPAPGASNGSYLKDDGTWGTPAGGGDVTAAANLVTDMITVGDGGLKGIKDTGVSIDGFDNLDTNGGDITGFDVWADNDVNVSNDLDVTDDASIGGDLDVTGAITAGGNVQLGEVSILLDNSISADGKWSGIAEAGTAGTTLAFGDLIYFAVADSRWELADADTEAKTKTKLGICILAAANDGDPTTILLWGKINAATAFPDLTIGAPVFISTTDGDVQIAAPSGSGDCIRLIGYGNTIDELFFCPELTWMVLA